MNKDEILKSLEFIDKAIYLTKNVMYNSQVLCQELENKMLGLGVESVLGGKYILREIETSLIRDTSLYMKVGGSCGYVMLDTKHISATRSESYLYDDFKATYNKPNRQDVMAFLQDIPNIIKELAKYNENMSIPSFKNQGDEC